MADWLETVYEEHRQGLFTLALAITGSREDAEDAVHDTFARLCRLQANCPADPAPYVFAAVRNAARDCLRRVRLPETPGMTIFHLPARAQDDPGHGLAEREGDRQVQQAIESLAQDKRQLVVMKVYGRLTFAQIVAVLGEPLSTISSRYQRALDEMRVVLEVQSS